MSSYDDIKCKNCGEIFGHIFAKWCKPCEINNIKKNFVNLSGNEKIDELIQKMQLKIESYKDIVVEWIPYNQLNDIKEIGKDDSTIIYSARWMDGPLNYDDYDGNYEKRMPNKKVSLKYLNNSQNITTEFLNELVESYSTDTFKIDILKIYGISQNPDTKDYIIVLDDAFCENCGNQYTEICGVQYTNAIPIKWCKPCKINNLNQNFSNWTSENKKIDEFIQEMQLKIESYSDIIVEWIPYNQFNDIKKIGNDDITIIYSAVWINGPLEYEDDKEEYNRMPNKEVALKCFYNSQIIINELLNEAKSYTIKRYENNIPKIYGISQNLDTKDYIMVLINEFCENCGNYYSNISYKWCKSCIINDLKQDFTKWTSGNEEIDEFIQEMQLKINNCDDIIIEWISYKQFIDIKEISKNDSVTIYLARWIDGPLNYNKYGKKGYERISNKEVVLKYLNDSQNIISKFISEAKSYSINDSEYNIPNIYGISYNSDTNDYFMILQNNFCENCSNQYTDSYQQWCKSCQINNLKQNFKNWTSGNKKIDKFIQEIQLEINTWKDGIVEWIPYNQFDNIKEIGKGGFAIVYSAIWLNGPLKYNEKKYNRKPDKEVALKVLYNSQYITDEFINEVKAYYINYDDCVLKICGLSQNPDTKEYIMVLQYANIGNLNSYNNINRNWNWEEKLLILKDIIKGLMKIHKNEMAHRDFHIGNILLSFATDNIISGTGNSDFYLYISDMGLCGDVSNIDETNTYGVMPYVAPEVLKGKPYTQAADIYSFGMIMYFVATGRQPFSNCAHDHYLVLDICREGIRPEISESEAPKCYIDLMKRCWDSNLDNRPNAAEVVKFIELFNSDENEEFIDKVEEYRIVNLLPAENSQLNTHSQAYYTSRLLNPFTTEWREGLDCAIED
ncbi:unnamed protein product [Rhizophagus irregularis]|nr:unnamed protein product [Rhizophagus irregularis]